MVRRLQPGKVGLGWVDGLMAIPARDETGFCGFLEIRGREGVALIARHLLRGRVLMVAL